MHKEANGYRQSPRALRTSEISKRFGGAAAFDRISLSCIFDRARAVLGASGAGKSALVKRMSGVLTPTRAVLRCLVGAHHFIHSAGAGVSGISTAFQELLRVPELQVFENASVTAPLRRLSPIQQKREREIARHLLDRSDALAIRSDGFVRDLTLIQRQQVEITKALTTGAKPENANRPTHANTDWGDLGMKPIRFGIISTARIATKAVMPAMQASRLCDIVAISSRDGDRAAAIAKDFGIARSYGSHQALLDDPNVDAVYIATPNDSHVELALRAAVAGKHVLCEKPIALNGAEAATLLEARDRHKVEITEALMVRYQPRWLAARELVRQGRFGRIEVIHANFTVQIDDPEDIRLKPELGGGALYDVGVYPITAARFLFEAEPVRAQCRLVRSRTGVDRTVFGSLEFPDERYLMFSASLGLSWAHSDSGNRDGRLVRHAYQLCTTAGSGDKSGAAWSCGHPRRECGDSHLRAKQSIFAPSRGFCPRNTGGPAPAVAN